MPLAHVTVVLVRPQHPGNIGVAARAVANHGIGRLALVQPSGFDPDRARWMAPNSHHVIDEAHFCSSLSEAIGDARRVLATSARPRQWPWPVLTPGEAAEQIVGDPIPTAIVYGPEDSGLSTDDLGLCHGILTFPTEDRPSINLGQAVSITCAALLSAQRSRAQEPTSTPDVLVEASFQEALVQDGVDVLNAAGYLNGRSDRQVFGTLFRLLGRARPTQEEAEILRGMVRQIAWWFKERPR